MINGRGGGGGLARLAMSTIPRIDHWHRRQARQRELCLKMTDDPGAVVLKRLLLLSLLGVVVATRQLQPLPRRGRHVPGGAEDQGTTSHHAIRPIALGPVLRVTVISLVASR